MTDHASADITIEAMRAEIEHLRAVLETRDVIGQAKGMVMVRFDVGADDAFALLVGWSNRDEMKVYEIAKRVVERRVGTPD